LSSPSEQASPIREREEPRSASIKMPADDSGSDSGVDLNIKSLKTTGDLVVERNERADQRSLPPPAWEKFAMDPKLFGDEDEKGGEGQRGSVYGLDRATKKSREREKKDKEEEELRKAERQLKAISKHRSSDPHLEGSLRDLESHMSILNRANAGARPARAWKKEGSRSSDAKDDDD